MKAQSFGSLMDPLANSDYSPAQYGSHRQQPTQALIMMKARKEDYWNKIAMFNHKIHSLEQKEAAMKKKRDQLKMRELLAEQV